LAKKVVGVKRKKKHNLKTFLYFEITGLAMVLFAILGIAKLGIVGKVFNNMALFFFGSWDFLLLLIIGSMGFYLIIKRKLPQFNNKKSLSLFMFFSFVLILSHIKLFSNLSKNGEFINPSVIRNTWEIYWLVVQGKSTTTDIGGGMVGAILFSIFHLLFDTIGTKIAAFFMLIVSVILFFDKSLRDTLQKITNPTFNFFSSTINEIKEDLNNRKIIKEQNISNIEILSEDRNMERDINDIPIIFANEQNNEQTVEKVIPIEKKKDPKENSKLNNSIKVKLNNSEENLIEFNMDLPKQEYHLPKIDLLNTPTSKAEQADQNIIFEKAKTLERTFNSFGVKAKVTKVHVGPAVTKFEVHPDVGVKVSKIVSLVDDLALALAAKDIRMEAPIPGKSAIGIEVPNSEISLVTLREVIETIHKQKLESKLLIGLGRDISGDVIGAELDKMPHLLVAGATGSGKSVCINGIIVSLLLRSKPDEVKLMMIDPKMVELNVYNGIPHLLSPVVTDPRKASIALKKVVQEMERRYELFSYVGVRNIEGYNDYQVKSSSGEPKLPFIVVIVDELADLMMVASSDVEDSIIRLSQMARAAGIHMIIATQRPSVDVITGVIKANIPSRIAFAVSSQVDSRTILDTGGAEKLLGRGDMLYLPVGASKPIRVQGAYLTDSEVERIVNYVISQQKAEYSEEMVVNDDEKSKYNNIEDELYNDAVKLVIDMKTASVSMLQRRFRIGYTRAARLIDAMEENGIVGPYEGSKPREVLITDLKLLEG
jgi:S-DNA-T family DNA segregation ATPase FtsK/SpoIIIE